MKILLLNPPKYEEGRCFPYLSREECGIGTVSSNFLPSQIYLAANFLRNRGKDVEVLDATSTQFSLDGIDLVVAWVCVYSSFNKDIESLKRVKMERKRTVMILNDSHEGFEIEAMQRFDFIDASIRLWEREVVLDKLISRWEKGGYPDFPGVIYRKKERLIDTGRMPPLSNLNHLSSSSKILEEAPLEKYDSALITSSRGCPVGCAFCLYRNTGARMRRLEDVIEEIDTINTSIRRFHLLDTSALPENPVWMENFCDHLTRVREKVSWRTEIRAEQCDHNTLRNLSKAGCESVLIGVETLDPIIRDKIMAGTSPEMLKKAVEKLREADIHLIPTFYLGLPWDSEHTLLKIKEFLKETPIPSFELAYVKLWKGTPLYEECKKLGLLKRELWINDFIDWAAPLCDTLHLTKEELMQWMYKIRESTVMNPRYILQFLKEKRQVKTSYFIAFFNYLTHGLGRLWKRNI